MGHERVGALPRTKRWQDVVDDIADAASISVPSTVKCSSGSRLRRSAARTTSSNSCWPTWCSSSRSRFFVNTVASKLRTISCMPKNQRNSRLSSNSSQKARSSPRTTPSAATPSAGAPAESTAAPRPHTPGRTRATAGPQGLIGQGLDGAEQVIGWHALLQVHEGQHRHLRLACFYLHPAPPSAATVRLNVFQQPARHCTLTSLPYSPNRLR